MIGRTDGHKTTQKIKNKNTITTTIQKEGEEEMRDRKTTQQTNNNKQEKQQNNNTHTEIMRGRTEGPKTTQQQINKTK